MQIPEGWVILGILFIFPYLLARKGVFNTEKIIHEYMDSTDSYSKVLLDKLEVMTNHVSVFYKARISRPSNRAFEIARHTIYRLLYYRLGSVIYWLVQL